MLYEVLIVAEGPSRGRVVAAQPSPAQWGAKEGPPRFIVRTLEWPEEDSPPAVGYCWDFYGERLLGPPVVARYAALDTFHLLYHLYPLKTNDAWRRNLRQLARRMHVFNGRRLVAVAIDGDTVALGQVRDELPRCKLIPIDNDPRVGSDAQGLKTLLPMVRAIAPNEALFFAHAKGVSRPTSLGVEYWRNAMYHALLDRMSTVRETLTRYPCVGCCKQVHDPNHRWPSGLRWGSWHFSGTFWWVRSDALFADSRWTFVAEDRFGAEAYLGGLFAENQAATLYQPLPERGGGGPHYRPETHTIRIPDDDAPGRRASVVITCKGRLDQLRLSLPLWRAQEVQPGEVIVVDYGCPDGTAGYLQQHFPWVRCVRVTRDTREFNISRARNIGACAAQGDRLVMADADLLVGPDYLARLDAQLDAGADLVLAVTPAKHPERHETLTIISGQAAFTLDLFRRLRGYDEAMAGWGYDDIDFYERAKAAGARLRQVYAHNTLQHDDARRTAHYAEADKERSARENFARMADRSRPINPGGYGRL